MVVARDVLRLKNARWTKPRIGLPGLTRPETSHSPAQPGLSQARPGWTLVGLTQPMA